MDPDNAITVTYQGDPDFEILVKPDEALAYRNGDIDDFENVLFVREIFTDAGAADRASAEEVEDEFGTNNIIEAAEELFNSGEMELTTEQRNELREEKRKQVISLIARRSMNPQTNSPHPPKRIENAMDEAGVTIDPMETAEQQIGDVIDKIRRKMPISMEEKEIAIRIPNEYAGKCYGKIQDMAEVLEEEWGDDALMARVKLPAGAQEELEQELNKICHGDLEIKDL
ncbi:MAG: ribosome assembly factor SBDS [Candidatus Nanohaloarchaea archaeon]|nr:ribosome assembly factor SBDS [Candidatus Nanohaloarchaea archaeon]